jgi:ergothioneine biosynthesis protein EgtB
MPLDNIPVKSPGAEDRQLKLTSRLFATRRLSTAIAGPLSAEDQVVQAHDDASPAKWHLAHTTWFFEELVLKPYLRGYEAFDPRFAYCFNSYYESLGARHPRPRRGLLTRPSADEIRAYRAHVDVRLEQLAAEALPEGALGLIEIGINHEQQHQELMLTDILALFSANPLRPAYEEAREALVFGDAPAARWRTVAGGVREIGHRGPRFAYDNESPAHQTLLRDFRICDRLVTNGEWLAFMEAGGYATPSLWLSDGWATVQREGWEAPEYWERRDGAWLQMTLHGLRPIEESRPVTHVSFYEADAFARFTGKRLPTEFEWEAAADGEAEPSPHHAHLLPPPAASGESGFFGSVWQWTQSAYLPYPGYRSATGALGEYNGKFMCNQMVLRGSSFATPPGHSRQTYRNFFYPHQRWQFMGLRLAEDA